MTVMLPNIKFELVLSTYEQMAKFRLSQNVGKSSFQEKALLKLPTRGQRLSSLIVSLDQSLKRNLIFIISYRHTYIAKIL